MDVDNCFIELNIRKIKPNLYKINEYGELYSLYFNKILSPSKDKDGYLKIMLMCNDGKRHSFRLATLVILAFKGEPNENIKDPTVNHIDENILNNHFNNLEWIERSINSSIRSGKPIGEKKNGSSTLTEKQVIEIAELLKEGKLNMVEIGNIYMEFLN
ncbi:TPA: hypothetical protein LA460_000143 [Clostridium botulinum]|nr:hypothetical protein [Clostridium botulinum]HBJ1652748.1 hypothetical protein [Clostridium botulinum]